MSSTTLRGKRVLITQTDAFMGPMLCEVFAEHGASVIANTQSLVHPEAPAAVVVAAGQIDVLIANLAVPAPSTGEDAEFAVYPCSEAASCFVAKYFRSVVAG